MDAAPDNLRGLSVCFIAGLLAQGGAERQLFYILKALHEQGAKPHVLCLTQGDFWQGRIEQLGIPVTWVGEARSRWKRLVRIIRELKRHRPSAVQSQHFFTNSYAIAAGRLCRLADIGAMRSNGVRELSANGSWFGWLSLRLPRVIAANSLAGIRFARQRGIPERKLYFLPNVVDTEQFTPRGAAQNEAITLLAAGRLVREKRFDRFLSVLAQVRRHCARPVKGLIVGPRDPRRDLEPELVRQAAELKLDSTALEFRGASSDMARVYQEADVYVLTSDFEGTPNVVLEAMSAGLPVVATSVGGVPEVIRHGVTGFLTAPDDEASMTSTLLRLACDFELRRDMGRKARDYVEQRHSFHRLPLFLSELYRRAGI